MFEDICIKTNIYPKCFHYAQNENIDLVICISKSDKSNRIFETIDSRILIISTKEVASFLRSQKNENI